MADAFGQIGPGILATLGTNTSTVTSITIDQVGDAAEWVFEAEEDATIVALGFRYATKGAGAPPQYTIAIKDVSSGVPGPTTLASATFTPPNDASWNNTWQKITLSSSVNVTQGASYSITISTAGTPNSDVFTLAMPSGVAFFNHPCAILNNNGVRTRQTGVPLFAYYSASKTYWYAAQTFTNVTYNDTSNPDEHGIAFTLNSGHGDTYKISGAKVMGAVSATTGNVLVSLETTGGTVLATGSMSKAEISSSTRRLIRFLLTSRPTLSYGTEYYLWFKSDDSANFTPNSITFASAADAEAVSGGNQYAYITRNNGGAVTEDAARRLMADLIFVDITEPVGGGATYIFNSEG